jgi:hypothetical protein
MLQLKHRCWHINYDISETSVGEFSLVFTSADFWDSVDIALILLYCPHDTWLLQSCIPDVFMNPIGLQCHKYY